MRNNIWFFQCGAHPKIWWSAVVEALALCATCVSKSCADLHSFYHSFWQKTFPWINSFSLWGLGSVLSKSQSKIWLNSPSISKKDPHHWSKHTSLAFQTFYCIWSRCLFNRPFNANQAAFFSIGTKNLKPGQLRVILKLCKYFTWL